MPIKRNSVEKNDRWKTNKEYSICTKQAGSGQNEAARKTKKTALHQANDIGLRLKKHVITQ
jgi:hypothetical protein